MGRVIHFDLTADNIERAKAFYEKIFNWRFTKWEGPFDYWLVKTGPEDQPGIDGGLTKREENMDLVMTTIEVDSIDNSLSEISAAGGEIIENKGVIPGVGYFAQFKDPEGNLMGLLENNQNAE